jgi:LAO/AO transport system kinase
MSGAPLVERLLSGDDRALARSISLVEEGSALAPELLRDIFPRTGGARIVGLTGAPGAGKSSLADRLVGICRRQSDKVGVVAIDPSSAYSGGAILGDRVRMLDHARDSGVFIRSMATRGYLGGLSRTTNDAIDLMDAAGYDPIIVETVGVGQDEVDVVKTADCVVVVLVPGMGDDIQAIKAGILEIADIFVINKSDHPGADRLHSDLEYMISMVEQKGRAKPPILHTVATENRGVQELWQSIRERLSSPGRERIDGRRRERAEARLLALLADRLLQLVRSEALTADSFREIVEAIARRQLDPYSAAEQILQRVEVR